MSEENETYLELDFNDVKPDPAQPRKDFCEKKLGDLAASMRVEGQILAIVVRENPDYTIGANATKYLIVDGERRWRAAQRAGLTHIEALCKSFNNVYAVQMMANESVALNPVEKAEAIQRRIDELTRSGETSPKMVVAREQGKSPAWVSKALKIMTLDEQIRELARTGKVVDMTTLQKLQKCKEPRRKEAFDLISQGQFCAKAFFRRKKPAQPSQLIGNNETDNKENGSSIRAKAAKPKVFGLRFTRNQLVFLFDKSGYSNFLKLSGKNVDTANDSELENEFKSFTNWLERGPNQELNCSA